jgi:type IV pilus assembly protein PilB
MPLGKVQTQVVAKLEEFGRITSEQRQALAAHPDELSGEALDKLLQENHGITPFQLLVARAQALGLAPCNVTRHRVSATTFERIPQEYCQEHVVLPVGQVGDFLLVAFANPFEVTVPARLQEMTGKRIIRLLGREKDIREKFSKSNERAGFDEVVQQIGAEFGKTGEESASEEVNEESGPIIQLSNRVIEDAYYLGASDIHVEPQEKEMVVRYRIDGVCQEKLRLPARVGPALVARLKIMCNLDIAERRLPQDGRINLELDGRRYDVRIATIPSVNGESVSLRLLGRERLDLSGLGMDDHLEARIRSLLALPNGIILVTGPTGCGKSSTLYTFLRELNTRERRIVTIEDPVENKLDGVVQIAVKPEINLTFAAGLRSILRGDPNVLMVGEMRDLETTEIAIRGALTGHLVFSTLHTNDAVGGISRLLDMGIEPFLIASSVRAFLAQRLVRRLCPACRQPAPPELYPRQYLESLGFPPDRKGSILVPAGCRDCRGTGYRGRMAIIEVCAITPEMQDLITARAPASAMRAKAIAEGMIPMREYGWAKVAAGETTIDEVIAVTAAGEHIT